MASKSSRSILAREPPARNIVLFISILVIMGTMLPASILAYSGREAAYTALPPMTLTVIGSSGTQVVLHETEIGNLPSYRAYGGYKNVLGNIRGLGYYTGVRLTTLCNLVGGMRAGDTLRVIASDGYQQDFTYSQVVLGEFVTYDPTTGEQVPHAQPLVPIMAYYYNDANIPDGPLRSAIVGPEGLATDSIYWVKYAVKIEILGGSVGGIVVPLDNVAIIYNFWGYAAAAVFLTGFLTVILIVVRRKHYSRK
jgi:hypothetical protein